MGLGFTFPHVWMFFERERERICRGLKGLPHPSKPLLSISLNWENFGGGGILV